MNTCQDTSVEAVLITAEGTMLKVEELLVAVQEAQKNFNTLFNWLLRTIHRLDRLPGRIFIRSNVRFNCLFQSATRNVMVPCCLLMCIVLRRFCNNLTKAVKIYCKETFYRWKN